MTSPLSSDGDVTEEAERKKLLRRLDDFVAAREAYVKKPTARHQTELRFAVENIERMIFPPLREPLPEWVEKVVARIDARGAHHQMEHEKALVYMRDYINDRLSATPPSETP